ncbi:MAG: YebC/PmpR family DNA-binding transcriptional regulator [Pirellulaceae bacterium]|nr:YebC/PmpR family DNA-binding transcriptional regulator [Pirellulaceae bacterium]
MAGHSHWAGIKHKKALIDNKRGKIWSKISKALIVAAKLGGGDPDNNPRLRQAISDAKSARMPKDTITRAIKKGTGELEGENFEEFLYEGYGPEGVAVMCEIMTDNRNRTAPEVRKIFEVAGGKLGVTGCVSYLFERKGLFLFDTDSVEEEQLLEVIMEAGGEDVKESGKNYEVTCDPEIYADLAQAFEEAKIEPVSKQVTMIPSSTIDLEAASAKKVFKLMERLDDHDDVQSVSANWNVSAEVMEQIAQEVS